MIEWQDAVAKVMGAIKCSPTERRRAFQYLHDSGIAYKIGGKIADATRAMISEEEHNEQQG